MEMIWKILIILSDQLRTPGQPPIVHPTIRQSTQQPCNFVIQGSTPLQQSK